MTPSNDWKWSSYIKHTINGHFFLLLYNSVITNVQLGVVLFFTKLYADHILKMVRTSHLLDVYRSMLLYFDIIVNYFYQFRTGSYLALVFLFVSSQIQHLNFNHYEYQIGESIFLDGTIRPLWSLACCPLHYDPISTGIRFFSLRKMYQYSETLALLFLSLIPQTCFSK